MSRKKANRQSSQGQARIPNFEKIIALSLASIVVITLCLLVLSPGVMNSGTLAIIRYLAAFSSGLSAYLFLGEVHIQGRIRRVFVRASGGFALFIIVLLLFFYGIPSSNGSSNGNPSSQRNTLELVDLRVIDDPEQIAQFLTQEFQAPVPFEEGANRFPILDILLRNKGISAVVLKELDLNVKKIDHQQEFLTFCSPLAPTWNYHLLLDSSLTNEHKNLSISQVIEGHGADRFTLTIGSDSLGGSYALYSIEIKLFYNENDLLDLGTVQLRVEGASCGYGEKMSVTDAMPRTEN